MGKLNILNFQKKQVGQISVTVTVTNHIDQILAERGFIPPTEVRSVTLSEVLVDTGATLLCLPKPVIEQLGLPVDSETTIKTAAGSRQARLFREAHIALHGRHSTFDCLELSDIDLPLLGVLPMERLGLEPDLQNQRLQLLPTDGDDTYILAL